jgi:hypothetical protein
MFGKQLINLESTVFEFRTVANNLPSANFFIKGSLRKMVDYGTVFIVDPEILPLDPLAVDLVVSMSTTPEGPHFSAPLHWRMPQVLKALGAFKSATAAMKNGWDLDIPEGYSEHQIRINNVKGVICVHKITRTNKLFS